MSRQRDWQKKIRKLGRCIICGKPSVTSDRCRFHADKVNERNINRYHTKKQEERLFDLTMSNISSG